MGEFAEIWRGFVLFSQQQYWREETKGEFFEKFAEIFCGDLKKAFLEAMLAG